MYIKINPGRLVAQATKFRMVASNIQRNYCRFYPFPHPQMYTSSHASGRMRHVTARFSEVGPRYGTSMLPSRRLEFGGGA